MKHCLLWDSEWIHGNQRGTKWDQDACLLLFLLKVASFVEVGIGIFTEEFFTNKKIVMAEKVLNKCPLGDAMCTGILRGI